MREGSNMATFARRRTAAAILVVAMVIGMSATGAWAQEYAGSTVTTGNTGDEGGAVLVLAPGVTINDGDVSNETGIGVVINGGTSAGDAPAGGTNASVVE
jgi:hypothetical protein